MLERSRIALTFALAFKCLMLPLSIVFFGLHICPQRFALAFPVVHFSHTRTHLFLQQWVRMSIFMRRVPKMHCNMHIRRDPPPFRSSVPLCKLGSNDSLSSSRLPPGTLGGFHKQDLQH